MEEFVRKKKIKSNKLSAQLARQSKHLTLTSSSIKGNSWLAHIANNVNHRANKLCNSIWRQRRTIGRQFPHSRSHKPSHDCRNGPACGLFFGDTLKGLAVIHRSLWMYSLGRITSCHLHVGGQFVSTGLQSWRLWPWNLAALSANCLWVAFKFIDSLGDIVLLLCPQPIVNSLNYGSLFSVLVLHGWPGAREQCDAQRECPLRGQNRRPLQVPQSFS